MKITKSRIFHTSFVQIILAIFSFTFITIAVLTIKLFNNGNCNCNHPDSLQGSLPYEPLINFEKPSSEHKLAILVPYRERFEELLTFVPYIHRFLLRQKINHDIFILNQVDTFRFNRASLINVGYLETRINYSYIAMHDVDLLPLNHNLSYSYPKMPTHIAAPNLHPRYHYEKFIGGILLINREHFELVNGMSNRYWGWGLEDDEFYVRLKDANLTVVRPKDITTGTKDTFRHIHGKDRKRDMEKCYNQKEVTRRRDRQTGLHSVKYNILKRTKLLIEESPVTIINIQLICDHSLTPWCDCGPKKSDNKKS